jgi:uncharacterized protein YhaN
MDIRTYPVTPVTPVTHDALRAENERLRNELDAMTAHWCNAENALADANRRHADIIEQWKAEENMWRDCDKKQLAEIDAIRAELDAMRQAHSVIAARMAAMGC